MPLPAALAPKIDPLIRRLGSGFDGERLATLLALERTLKRHGCSFHDLADRIGKASIVLRAARRPSPGRATHADLLVMASQLDGHPDLSPWENNFVSNVRRTLRRGFPLSTKQRRILTRIWERVGDEAAA
jgi:hypothetical protein